MCGPDTDGVESEFVSGETIANSVVVKVRTGGKVCLFTMTPTHLVADVSAYHT